MPFLKKVVLRWHDCPPEQQDLFPYHIPALRNLDELEFKHKVTFLVGENGSGKSTLLEAIGVSCGFSIVGGKDLVITNEKDDASLSIIMNLQWMPRVKQGFYFRAETFDTFAKYIDELADDPSVGMSAYAPYGGKSLNVRSHGQGFLEFLTNRLSTKGLYLLDEPESALSPQNQLVLLRMIHEMESSGSQFIIATHSPILMSYPGACIYEFSEEGIIEVAYEDTEHFLLTRDFLNHRERYYKQLFED
ncbi:AAA family ATPase [Paenibacillus xylanexedens]|uniref:AAA family ATPase n=1 Tax=Paenibacillus xylanexedens TaxID=528191 RepID=UPI0011AAC473|nr:AAA family ATPase [Paenibacillus xylanexedens]